ncbi:Dienelactone hydrolase family protein [Mycena venus]|uniref:Dienelactone hydrolase family protein n=1 Tax=Mycena venus TaxID=2733690 RepID=A0A8H6XGF8_9AGAR|nr:Dienelactone hydrolase family protein [Mycena venus]
MPTLDTRGIIAAAQLGGYVPIAAISLYLVIRYALRRDAGWLFMFIFSLARIAGGALIVAGELMKNPSPDLFTAAYILFHAGLAVLMLSTIGFLGLAGQHTYSEYLHTTRIGQAIAFFVFVAMALAIAGGILGTHLAPAQGHIGDILRKTSACFFSGGILFALPVLGARVAYEILAAWSSSDLFGLEPASNATLAMFQPITGKWILFLVLGFVCEFVVAALYMLSSTVLARPRRHR